MYPNELDVMIKREQVKDWLREVDHDRFLKTIEYKSASTKCNPPATRRGIRWMPSISASLKVIQHAVERMQRGNVVHHKPIENCTGKNCPSTAKTIC